MSEFVFSSYVIELKNAWRETIANEALIQFLYDSIIMTLSLMDKNGEYITVKKETAKQNFDSELFKIWSDVFEKAVKECGYPNCSTAGISRDTFDAVINGKQKRNEGKGYRVFINTVYCRGIYSNEVRRKTWNICAQSIVSRLTDFVTKGARSRKGHRWNES